MPPPAPSQGPGLPHRLLRVLMDYTQCDPKPYLGGTRNKRTTTVFHHAVTQVLAPNPACCVGYAVCACLSTLCCS